MIPQEWTAHRNFSTVLFTVLCFVGFANNYVRVLLHSIYVAHYGDTHEAWSQITVTEMFSFFHIFPWAASATWVSPDTKRRSKKLMFKLFTNFNVLLLFRGSRWLFEESDVYFWTLSKSKRIFNTFPAHFQGASEVGSSGVDTVIQPPATATTLHYALHSTGFVGRMSAVIGRAPVRDIENFRLHPACILHFCWAWNNPKSWSHVIAKLNRTMCWAVHMALRSVQHTSMWYELSGDVLHVQWKDCRTATVGVLTSAHSVNVCVQIKWCTKANGRHVVQSRHTICIHESNVNMGGGEKLDH